MRCGIPGKNQSECRFQKEQADERIKDPLKRAILQRDLRAVFSTTVADARPVIRVDEQSGRISICRTI